MYNKRDVIARDLTGTGKTLAFCLPLVERFRKQGYFQSQEGTRCIILAPTRELVIQVSKQLEQLKHSRNEFRVATIYGGVSYTPQIHAISSGVEFIVATTGRLLDLMNSNETKFKKVDAVILDEADRILDMGFQKDVEYILNEVESQSEKKPQIILFSATVPGWVRDIARNHLDADHLYVDLVRSLKNKTAKSVEHFSVQWEASDKIDSLVDLLSVHFKPDCKIIVFTETKAEATRVAASPAFHKKSQFEGGITLE